MLCPPWRIHRLVSDGVGARDSGPDTPCYKVFFGYLGQNFNSTLYNRRDHLSGRYLATEWGFGYGIWVCRSRVME
jgi:hypothetical protein